MADELRPRGIGGDFGISEVAGPVDGDDYTYDWHAPREQMTGTMTGGEVQGLRYDVRTGPERVSWQVSTALHALGRQVELLERRVAAAEAELERRRGTL